MESTALAGRSTPPRIESVIDSGWEFFQGDSPGAQLPGFDDSSWTPVSLPHSWVGATPTTYYRGVGWYRKKLVFETRENNGKHVFLRFGAANQIAEVYWNGALLGRHEGGYTAFAFDITPQLREGENVIAVKVDNSPNVDIAPVMADYNFWGGIYRDVTLIETGDVHVSPLDFASPGVYVSQTSVSSDSAEISVRTVIDNSSHDPNTIDVVATVLDASRKTITKANLTLVLQPGARLTPSQSLQIAHPRLWNGKADPYLYQVDVKLLRQGQLLDEVTQPLGLRFFSVDANTGFSLNGKPLALNGVDMHQDWAGKGWALGSNERRENVRILLDLGANSVRLAHYPHSQETLDLLDRAGIVAWAEIPMVNVVTPSPDFERTTKQQLTELIRQSYNHPSICFWSLFNEIKDDSLGLVAQLDALAHAEDPSRLTTGASNKGGHTLGTYGTDLLGVNRYNGWYSGSLADFGKDLDSIHAQFPALRLGVSEYGAGASLDQHQDPVLQPSPGGHFHPMEWQNFFHETYYPMLEARPFVWGHFVWNLFDFASASRNEGDTPGMNDKGLASYDRKTAKDAYYFYRAHWNPEPTLHLTSADFIQRPSRNVDVKAYSNLESPRLRVNGVLQPAPERSDSVVWTWKGITLESGANQITVEATANGQPLSEQATWSAP